MAIRVGFRFLACLLVLALGFGIFPTVFPGRVDVWAVEEYVYYGYVPENITATGAQPTWQRLDHGHLIILGNQNGTEVKVYALPEKTLIDEFTVNRMENMTLTLPNATFFKVWANRPVSVTLMGGGNLERVEAMITTFFTSTQGGYIGREFIFPSVHGKLMTLIWYHVIPGLPYKIYALEESDVQVWDPNGTKVSEFHLAPNKYQELELPAFRTYRLTSTGNVMLQTFTRDHSSFYPAVERGFIGTLFYGASVTKEFWEMGQGWPGNQTFVATSTKPGKLTPVNLEYDRKLDQVDVAAGLNVSFKPLAFHMAVKSEEPILLMYKSDDTMGGVASMGLKAGQTAVLYAPPGYTYAFAHKETVVNLDDVTLRLQPDSVLVIPSGVHRLSASENLIVQVTNIVQGRGINAFGACLPSVQSLDITYEGLRVKPLASEELPWPYIAGAGAVALAALYLVKRRRAGAA